MMAARVGSEPRPAPIFGLDLVRAAAVSLVLLSHGGDIAARWIGATNLRLFSYGAFYGIELFFVLSGFLIGGLLIEQIDRTDRHDRMRSWRIFMVRRWLRTLPLYYVVLAAIALLWAPTLWPDRAHLGAALLWFAPMLQNLAWPMRAGNFFDVSWSLAVEEWFYVGFSALLFGVACRSRRAALPVAILVFVLAPIIWRWFGRAAPGSSDHLVVYWLDSIAIGVIAAWVAARRPAVFRAAAFGAPVGIALVWFTYFGGLAALHASGRVQRCFDSDLVAVALVLLLPAACRWQQARGPLAAMVRVLSRLSYPLYLVHLSILVGVDAKRVAWHLSPMASVLMSVGLIGGLSYALSRWVERPIMRRRPDDRPHQAHSPSSSAPAPEANQAAVMPGGA